MNCLPCAPYAGTRLNRRKQCLIAAEPAEEGLKADVKMLCRTQAIPQPSLGEVSPSTMKWPLERKAVNTNELNVSEHSPVAKTALMPPKLPASSIWATSPRQDEIKPPSPVLPEQNGCAKSGGNINAHPLTSPGAQSSVPKEAIIQPGVDPPSTRIRPKSKVVSNEETSTRKCSPTAKAAPTLSDHLPAVAT